MEPIRDDNDLIAELRGLRPTPAPEFAAALDERVAAGFPRRSAPSSSPLSGTIARLRALPPRRLVLSVGATALAAVAAATVVVSNRGAEEGGAYLIPLNSTAGPAMRPDAGSGPGAVEESGSASAQPPRAKAGEGSSGIEYESAPSVPADGSATSANSQSRTATGPFASKTRQRDVERSAEMVLGAEPADVGGVANKVFEAVHAVDGIVLSSSVSGGAEGDAGARFDLLIPAAKLSDALADFSGIAEVRSRHEATDDITAATVSTGEHLQDSQARIDGLLVQLAAADNESERIEVETELRRERHHAAALRTSLTKLDRRANLSRVSLRIETGGASIGDDSGGSWSIGDALDDAGRILAVAAGAIVVGLAILAPIAAIALLIWLADRARVRRARERALG